MGRRWCWVRCGSRTLFCFAGAGVGCLSLREGVSRGTGSGSLHVRIANTRGPTYSPEPDPLADRTRRRATARAPSGALAPHPKRSHAIPRTAAGPGPSRSHIARVKGPTSSVAHPSAQRCSAERRVAQNGRAHRLSDKTSNRWKVRHACARRRATTADHLPSPTEPREAPPQTRRTEPRSTHPKRHSAKRASLGAIGRDD
jgi:hypothetical protein